jgi:hypothetical protein
MMGWFYPESEWAVELIKKSTSVRNVPEFVIQQSFKKALHVVYKRKTESMKSAY